MLSVSIWMLLTLSPPFSLLNVEIPVLWGTLPEVKILNVHGQWKLQHITPEGRTKTVKIDPKTEIWLKVTSPLCSYKKALAEECYQFKLLQNVELRKKERPNSATTQVFEQVTMNKIKEDLSLID